jgi:hypothetical protein
LFVEAGGIYSGLPAVDAWDIERDARRYAGPWPVVAHPPCARWGRYWGGGPSAKVPRQLGDDGGAFASALASVRQWGGVLEHPQGSHAWRQFVLPIPHCKGGWQRGLCGGWSCCVEQGAYGHRARKGTWLYAFGCELPALHWGPAAGQFVRLDAGHKTRHDRQQAKRQAPTKRILRRELAATPPQFRDVLIAIARTAHRNQPAT